VLPEPFIRLRQILRYRRLLVECEVRMKNKIAGLLMECGIEYDRARLHGNNYFRRLLKQNQEIPPTAIALLEFSREQADTLHRMEQRLAQGLGESPQLAERVNRLMQIPGVGLIVALTWALEVGPVERIGSTAQAISYCGLTSALRSSADVVKRGPISKQRNRHLQSVVVETAKLAPQWNPRLAVVHEREKQRGHANRATLAVARKLVAYLLAADRGHQPAPATAATPA
jgi:transposase